MAVIYALLLLLTAVNGSPATASACDDARNLVQAARQPFDLVLGQPVNGSICGESCCSDQLQHIMYKSIEKSVDLFIKDAVSKVASLMEARAKSFDDFFRHMMNQSRTELHIMFERTYGKIYLDHSGVFADFFEELKTYYDKGTVRLSETMETFFGVLYQRMFTVINRQYEFDDKYLGCVAENMVDMKPFGDVPNKLGVQLRRSFVATRTLYKALSKGATVASAMTSIRMNDACLRNVVQMQYCGRCSGISAPACSEYCNEALINCLSSYSELGEAWDNFINAIEKVAERLTGPYDIEAVVEPLNIKISEAIMIFQENGATISEKIFQKCGKPAIKKRRRRKASFKNSMEDTSNIEMGLDGLQKPGKRKHKKTQTKDHVPEFKKILFEIKSKVKDTKQFWQQLPYQYCNNEEISASPSDNGKCWNSTSIGTYTRSNITSNYPPSSVVSEQIYNLNGFTEKLKKAFHGQEVEFVDDTEEVMAGSGSGSGDGIDDEDEDDDDVFIDQNVNRNVDVAAPTTTTTEAPPVVYQTSNAVRGTMSLPRALAHFLVPIVMAWFGGAIRDLL